jgi:hypothetical protein
LTDARIIVNKIEKISDRRSVTLEWRELWPGFGAGERVQTMNKCKQMFDTLRAQEKHVTLHVAYPMQVAIASKFQSVDLYQIHDESALWSESK